MGDNRVGSGSFCTPNLMYGMRIGERPDWSNEPPDISIAEINLRGFTTNARPAFERMLEQPWLSQPSFKKALVDSGATLQQIGNGCGPVQFDEYSFVIDRLPPNTTPQKLLEQFALAPNALTNDNGFGLMNEFAYQGTRGVAVGQKYDIDIFGPDNGAVLLVDKTAERITVQTIEDRELSTHPEFGVREFGFDRLENGAVRFYTRGVSQARDTVTGMGAAMPQAVSWSRLCRGISDAVEAQGGASRPESFRGQRTWYDLAEAER